MRPIRTGFLQTTALENGSYTLLNIGRRRKTLINSNTVVNQVKLRLDNRIQIGKNLFCFATG